LSVRKDAHEQLCITLSFHGCADIVRAYRTRKSKVKAATGKRLQKSVHLWERLKKKKWRPRSSF